MKESLSAYRKRRKFKGSPEPKGLKKTSKTSQTSRGSTFVVQKHHARTLHYDVRLQIGKVLKSWAVPKGPPKRIGVKHLAILTEDHPLEYASFEGEIPEGHYGAGKVEIWDKGTFENVKSDSLATCFKNGVIEFKPSGKRLKGTYALVHFKEKNWLMIKVKTKR